MQWLAPKAGGEQVALELHAQLFPLLLFAGNLLQFAVPLKLHAQAVAGNQVLVIDNVQHGLAVEAQQLVAGPQPQLHAEGSGRDRRDDVRHRPFERLLVMLTAQMAKTLLQIIIPQLGALVK